MTEGELFFPDSQAILGQKSTEKPFRFLVCLFFSAVILRFGTKGFGVLWIVVWGSFMLIPASLSSASEGGTSLLAKLGNGILWLAGILPPLAWAGVGAALVIAMTTAGVLFLRQAEVRL